MKSKVFPLLTLLVVIVSLLGCIDPPPPPAPTPVTGDIYSDPKGLFSVPIPTNWTAVQTHDGYGILTSPDEMVTVYVIAVEAESMEDGITAAWEIIDPMFDLEPDEIIEQPAQNGADLTATIVYDTGNDENILLAGGWLYRNIAYIEIFKTDLVTFQKRGSQVQIIDTGFAIAALAPIDLKGIEPLPISEELLAELEAYIIDVMDRFDVPGLSIAIVKDGEIVYAEGFGVRELGSDDPVTPETLMLIGSTTKTMTTMLMAQLVDSGFMSWGTPVVDILPTFAVADPVITQKITIKDLVCACTGVPRRDFELIFNADELAAEDIVDSLAEFEFFTDFGEAFQYSNQMVATGGYIAAMAAGGSYGSLNNDYITLMQESVFDPIGMTNTTFSFDKAKDSGNYGIPHSDNIIGEYSPMPIENEAMFLQPIGPAGGAWSNVMDMSRYIITELNQGITPDGRQVVSAENLAKTWEPQVAITNDMSYGLGWIVGQYKGLPTLEHGGNTLGFSSELVFLPDVGLGASILTNQRVSFANQMVRMRLLELLYQQEPDFDALVESQMSLVAEAIAEFEEDIHEAVDPEPVEPYLGTYTNPMLGEIIAEWRDDKLILDAGEFQAEIRSILTAEGEVSYFLYDSVLKGLGIEPGEDEEGNLTVTIGAGVNEYLFTKVE